MIFEKFGRTEREVTAGRLRSARQSLAKQRARLALFAEQVEWESPEQRIEAQDAKIEAHERKFREHLAAMWKRSRAKVRQLPEAEQRELLAAWSKSFSPKSAEYFADFVHQWMKHRMAADQQ